MIGVVQGEARNSYYAGLIMVFIVLYTWSRVRFVWATLTGWLIVVAYEILTLGFLHVPAQTVLTHNFFFVGSNVLGMLACYSIERYARREFVLAGLLREERERVRKTNEELAAANAELEEEALLDELTRSPNRRRFDQELPRAWRQMTREGRPLGLLICDIDHFKLYNDTYGHPSGDECLIKVAQMVEKGARRPHDFAARYGGEEFAVILPGDTIQGAGHVAQDICQSVRSLSIPHSRSDAADCVTISIGAAAIFPTLERGPEVLFKKADECLYQAKQQGRNQVVAAKV
jgi:diguanylate cyclase (GGDEF)-like protein